MGSEILGVDECACPSRVAANNRLASLQASQNKQKTKKAQTSNRATRQASVTAKRALPKMVKTQPIIAGRRRSNVVQRIPPQVRAGFPRHLSNCGYKYFVAVHNPWSPDAIGACIPTQMSVGSQKFSSTTRFQMRAGVNGYGGVTFFPFRMFCSDQITTAAGFFPSCFATTAAYPETEVNPFKWTNGTGYSGADGSWYVPNIRTTSPYSRSYFGVDDGVPTRAVRLVGAAIRVSDSERLMDIKGEYIVWHNPAALSETLPSNDRAVDFLNQRDTCWNRITADNYVELTYLPRRDEDLQYVNSPGGITAWDTKTTATWNRMAGAILLNGVTPGATFTVEAIAHFEAQGEGLQMTSELGDPADVVLALAAAPNAPMPAARQGEDTNRDVDAMKNAIQKAEDNGEKLVTTGPAATNLVVKARNAKFFANTKRRGSP